MSRLDKMIRRLEAQRRLIDDAAAELAGRAGGPGLKLGLELGLGNGRTYHHLREKFPGWRLVAFDHALVAHPACVPAQGDLVLGEIAETAPAFVATAGPADFVHADMGDHTDENDRLLEAWLPAMIVGLTRPGAIVLASTRLAHAGLIARPYPDDLAPYDYFGYVRR